MTRRRPRVPVDSRLVDAAQVLDDRAHAQLRRLAALVKPHARELDRRFLGLLAGSNYDARQLRALSAITPGAAALAISGRGSADGFFEQVDYHGRRLAKLNVPPGEVALALRKYDRLLDPLLHRLAAREYSDLVRARRQLEFCVFLSLNNAYYHVREMETRAFYELFHAELEARSLGELVNRLMATLVDFCGARAGRLRLFADGRGLPAGVKRALLRPRYLESKRAAKLILDPSLLRGCASYWSIPLITRGVLAGVMQFGFSTRYEWLPRELQLLEAAGERCLMAAEKARLTEDLAAREAQVRQLSEHMLRVEEEERRRISRELHDDAGQSMLYIRLQLEMLEQSLPPGSEARAKAGEIRALTESTIADVRRVIAALSPAVLEQMGLAAGIRQLVKRFRQAFPARVNLRIAPHLGRLSRETEFIAYRLVQECLNNIAKHSQASHINLRLNSTDGLLELDVEDNGIGFDVGAALEKRDSFGLAGMRERVALLGGRLEIQGRPNRGTRISAELPIKEESKRR